MHADFIKIIDRFGNYKQPSVFRKLMFLHQNQRYYINHIDLFYHLRQVLIANMGVDITFPSGKR